MMIEIDDDFLDTIIQSALVKDYLYLTNDLKIYSKNSNYLHEDDAKAFEETAGAILTLSKWYFVHGEFEKQVKTAKKKT